MNRFPAWLALIVFASPALAHAQNDVAPVTTPTVLQAMVPPQARLSKRIVMVVDTSGSMEDEIAPVIHSIIKIAGQPVDEMEIALVAFRGDHDWKHRCTSWDKKYCHAVACSWRRWKGVPEKGIPRGWARLPSVTAVGVAAGWIRRIGADGSTDPTQAMYRVLMEPRGQLSVVLISDGLWCHPPVVEAIEIAQAERVRRGHGRAVIATYGIGKKAPMQFSLYEVGRSGHGGFWVQVPLKSSCSSRSR